MPMCHSGVSSRAEVRITPSPVPASEFYFDRIRFTVGRELGEYALHNYTNVKAVHVNLGHKM